MFSSVLNDQSWPWKSWKRWELRRLCSAFDWSALCSAIVIKSFNRLGVYVHVFNCAQKNFAGNSTKGELHTFTISIPADLHA